jgi:hypothetical protein
MRPIVRAIGKVLRLIGISSPEDAIRGLPPPRIPRPPESFSSTLLAYAQLASRQAKRTHIVASAQNGSIDLGVTFCLSSVSL